MHSLNIRLSVRLAFVTTMKLLIKEFALQVLSSVYMPTTIFWTVKPISYLSAVLPTQLLWQNATNLAQKAFIEPHPENVFKHGGVPLTLQLTGLHTTYIW